MNANLIIFLREFRIFAHFFLLNVVAIFLLAALKVLNPLPFLILIPAIYFIKIKGATTNSLVASLLFMITVIPTPWQEPHIFFCIAICLVLILYLQKHYSLRECSWASYTLGAKLAFCLYIDGFDLLIFISFLWFTLSSLKEMKINTDNKPPFNFIPKKN